MRCARRNRRKDNIKIGLDIVHSTLFTIRKHTTGNCYYGGQGETIKHVYELESTTGHHVHPTTELRR